MNLSNWVDMDKLQNTFNKVKNAVLQLSEYQVKVMEATSNEHWGASSTLMTDIANATNNYQHFTEIMETLYKRLQEPPGPTWRQPYKALQLLEYLIKNGSERAVDYAREHIYEVKAMKNFHYVDEKGKDQGINLRQRAKEITELLGDTDKIRDERKKAKENRNKYTGVSNLGGGGGRFGGFSGDSYRSGSGSNSFYGGSSFRDEDSQKNDTSPTRDVPLRASSTVSSQKINIKMAGASTYANKTVSKPTSDSAPAPLPPQQNLLEMDGDDWGDFASAPSAASATALSSSGFADFTSFQSAPISTPAPAPVSLPSFASFSTAPVAANSPLGVMGATHHFSLPATTTTTSASSANGLLGGFANFSVSPTSSANISTPASNFSAKSDPFAHLVSLDPNALSGVGKKQENTPPSLSSMSFMAFESPAAAGSAASSSIPAQPPKQNELADLLF